jgi:hypothetical protein
MAPFKSAAEHAATLLQNLAGLRAGLITLEESDAVAAKIRAEVAERQLAKEVVANLMTLMMHPRLEFYSPERPPTRMFDRAASRGRGRSRLNAGDFVQ